MTINDARTILNRVREGYPMSLAITTQALQRTGDIPELHGSTLRFNGDEPCDDRAVEVESEGIEGGFSYSRYLDCPTNKGVKE
jgi:hypothetical protein